MAKYKQSGKDRMDESLSARNGKKSQSFKDRRDESYAMKMRSDKKSSDLRGEKRMFYVDAYAAQKRDMGRMDWKKAGDRGTPSRAFDYQW